MGPACRRRKHIGYGKESDVMQESDDSQHRVVSRGEVVYPVRFEGARQVFGKKDVQNVR